MTRIIFYFSVIVASLFITSASASAALTLSGKMTKLHYLVGTWSCRTTVASTASMPAETETGTISFEVEPSNAIGFDLTAPKYSASGFIGYSTLNRTWWSAGSDNFGGVTLETGKSTDVANVIVLTGTTLQGTDRVATRDTITKTSDTRYEDVYETRRGSSWKMSADSVCAKTSNTPQ